MRAAALLVTAVLVVTFAACGKKDKKDDPKTTAASLAATTPEAAAVAADIPAWRIEVRGVPTITSFTSVDAQYLPRVEVEMTSVNALGITVTNRYGGITLRSMLNLFYVQDVVNVTVTAMDGSAKEYPQFVAMAADTILAWEVDGAPLETNPPLRMCTKSGESDLTVDMVSAVSIVPLTPDMTTTMPATADIPMLTYPVDPGTYPALPPVAPNNNTTKPTTTEATTTTTTTTTTTKTTKPTGASYVYIGPDGADSTTTTTTTTTKTSASTTTTASTDYNVFQ
jgi:hypothetical protein